MPCTIRPYRRYPMPCAVTYYAGLFQGEGTVWNFSLNGWKLSGDLPLRVGQTCSLTINFRSNPALLWLRRSCGVQGQEYGVETLVVDKPMHNRVKHRSID